MQRSGWITQEQLDAAAAVNWEPTFLTSPDRPAPVRAPPAGDDGDLPAMPSDEDAPAKPRPGADEPAAPKPNPFNFLDENDRPAGEPP